LDAALTDEQRADLAACLALVRIERRPSSTKPTPTFTVWANPQIPEIPT
jgi:hypothetical protein